MLMVTGKPTCGCGYLVLIFVLLYGVLTHSFKLNKPRILLPYHYYGLSSNYTLVVSGAEEVDCFEWESSNVNDVIVSPVYDSEGCSRKAIVSSHGSGKTRSVVRITVTLIRNKEQIFCDVILNTPKSIKLSTLTEELHIGGPPAEVAIIATDEFGHEFSSTNGLHFEWSLRHDVEDPKVNEVARLKKFADSRYSFSTDVNGLELRGIYADSVLVEAVNFGTCFVRALLKNKEGKELSTNDIKISVVNHFRIFPSSEIRLLRKGHVDIYVESMKNGVPNGRMHDFSVESFAGEEYGVTHKVLTSNNPILQDIPVELTVTKPSSIVIRISGGFDTIEAWKTYTILVELFDENENLIFPSDNLRVFVQFPSKQFFVHSSTKNGTYHVIQTTSPGKSVIKAEYKGVLLEDGTFVKDKEIHASLPVTVYQKLEIFPPYVFLPSESTTNPLHEISMKVTGGSGSYMWSTSNTSAARITFNPEDSHVGKLEILNESEFTVTVTDKTNINMISTAKLSIQPVFDVEVYPSVVETDIGNTLILPVALLGYESKEHKILRKFDDCAKIQPTVEIIEKHVIRYDPDPHIPGFGKGCLSLNFKCTSAGYSRINVSYKTFKTTTVVACFKPLKPIHPVRVAVLALGSSKEIAFEGGPRIFPLFKSGHYTKLEASDPDLLDIELVADIYRYNKDLTVFRVKCKALGENVLTFRIGNEPSATNPHPATAVTSIKVICNTPESIHLKLFRTSTNAKRDTLPENVVKVPFYGNKEFSVEIFVKDGMGRKFSNISSLNVLWEVSNSDLAAAENYTSFKTHENAVAGYRKVSRNFKEFKMSGETGKIQISAKLEGYNSEILIKERVPVPAKLEEISTSIDLDLVSLRDINAGLYSSSNGDSQPEVCDGDSCKS